MSRAFEKIPIKDVKMRTFITADSGRDNMVGHVYDVTYGIVKNLQDTLVVIDDSIVREPRSSAASCASWIACTPRR